MIKYCPIISFQKEYSSKERCMEDVCGFWDEARKQCCILTQALAAVDKAPVTPVIMQPAVTTIPAVTLNSSGDYPYKIDYALERGEL